MSDSHYVFSFLIFFVIIIFCKTGQTNDKIFEYSGVLKSIGGSSPRFCGAVIVHKFWLLTSASCFDGLQSNPDQWKLHVGTKEINSASANCGRQQTERSEKPNNEESNAQREEQAPYQQQSQRKKPLERYQVKQQEKQQEKQSENQQEKQSENQQEKQNENQQENQQEREKELSTKSTSGLGSSAGFGGNFDSLFKDFGKNMLKSQGKFFNTQIDSFAKDTSDFFKNSKSNWGSGWGSDKGSDWTTNNDWGSSKWKRSSFLCSATNEEYAIKKIILNSNYNSASGVNDLAMIKLKKPLNLGSTKKILKVRMTPKKIGTRWPNPKTECFAVTWCKNGRMSGNAKLVRTQVVRNQKCDAKLRISSIFKMQICSIFKSNNLCNSDVGGGLFCIIKSQPVLAGINSKSNEASIFSRISEMRNWVVSTAKSN